MQILKSSLTLLISLVIVVSLLLVAAMSYVNQRDIILGNEDQLFRSIETNFNQSVGTYLVQAQSNAAAIVFNPEVARLFSERDRDGLLRLTAPVYQQLRTQGIVQMQFHLAPATSFLRVNAPAQFGDDLSSFRHTVVQANQSQKPVIGIEEGVTGWGFRAVLPVMYQNVVVGSFETGMNFDVQFLEKELKQKQPGEYGVYALNADGSDKLLAATIKEDVVAVPPDTIKKAVSSATMIAGYSGDGTKAYVIIPVKDYSGKVKAYVKAVLDRTETLGKLKRNMMSTAGLLLVILLASVGVILLVMNRQLIRPVQQMMEKMELVAAGDLRTRFDTSQKGDIGRLSTAINKTVSQLRQLIGTIGSSADKVSSHSGSLAEAAEQTGATAGQVAATIAHIAEGAAEQIGQAEQIRKKIEETKEQVHSGLEEAGSTLEAASRTSRVATEGIKSLQQAIEQLGNVRTTVRFATESIHNLGRRSDEIGSIVDVITGIAGQTNLLALNAAIEAARAGEHGRGFGVVAEEVRKLAEGSAEAATKIGKLIRDIQAETSVTVRTMESNLEQVDVQVGAIESGGASMGEVTRAIEVTEENVGSLRNRLQTLDAHSDSVQDAVGGMTRVVQETAAAAEEVAASAQEQSAATEEMAALSKTVAEIAEDLKKMINQFRV
ncbi:MAG: methyl-accepting chemotaxis protein [Negativicutes bacterium]|nr:methyl-accepting chemotaxis protein [Negativicutes bacterium]